jgi:alpha-L-rhamnosidase
MRITHLRCEYLVNPLGIDERRPRLSWLLESDRRGARQVAYQIRVAGSRDALERGTGDFWDSGRVLSDETTQIEYAGRALVSRDVCYWHVDVWDETGAITRSDTASWTMGLLTPSDWTARWIAADPEILRRDSEAIVPSLTDCGTPALFRKEFEIDGPVRRATVYASARGLFELHLGGQRVGADRFAPEWTDYHKRIHFRTYDVTTLVAPGTNVLGAVLGDGWWSGFVGWQEARGRYGSLENSLLVQLEIELTGGRRQIVASDASWSCNTGPILSSDFMMGEIYDARRERGDWLSPLAHARSHDTQSDSPRNSERERVEVPGRGDGQRAVADSATANAPALAWLAAREVLPPSAPLVAQRSEPVRITEIITPCSTAEIRPGVFIYDLGQNISGFVRLQLDGLPSGTRLTVRHAERLNPDGTLYTENLRRAKATDVYVCRGGKEQWEPHFTFHGFQYVELTGLPFMPKPGLLTGCVVHSGTPLVGNFECSHAGVNRLWLNGVWSQRDNFLSVPTDCPQRDERLGWMGDAQVFIRTASYNADVAAFFTKWMIDVEDAQQPDGVFPDIAPRPREDINFTGLPGLAGSAGWADAGVIVPWTVWRVYGDRRIIERHWSAMAAWLDHLERTNPAGLRVNALGNNYGDWLCLPTDTSFGTHSPMKYLLATAYWADDAAKLARMAQEIGREADAARFQALFERVRAAFQNEYVRPDGRLTVETQTAYVLALAFDLLPASLRAAATEHLVANIRALDWHLSTGFIGISHLNPTLTLNGRSDVAYRLLLQETYPSWLYPVLHGATTIWERWNGWTEQDGFFNPSMNSFNHYSLGSIGEWLYRHVAGIELDPDVPGFKRFVLRPFIAAGLTHARAAYRTSHGEIVSEWSREGENFTWTVRVPANTTAQVCLPSEPGTPIENDELMLDDRQGGFVCGVAHAGAYRLRSSVRVGRAKQIQ